MLSAIRASDVSTHRIVSQKGRQGLAMDRLPRGSDDVWVYFGDKDTNWVKILLESGNLVKRDHDKTTNRTYRNVINPETTRKKVACTIIPP